MSGTPELCGEGRRVCEGGCPRARRRDTLLGSRDCPTQCLIAVQSDRGIRLHGRRGPEPREEPSWCRGPGVTGSSAPCWPRRGSWRSSPRTPAGWCCGWASCTGRERPSPTSRQRRWRRWRPRQGAQFCETILTCAATTVACRHTATRRADCGSVGRDLGQLCALPIGCVRAARCVAAAGRMVNPRCRAAKRA
jgi:hypothetical protein